MTTTEYANALRRIADFVETHPELGVPYEKSINYYHMEGKDDLAKAARAFGSCEKVFDENFAKVVKDFGGILLEAVVYRSQVCERVVVGKKTVPETIIPARLIPEHEEDIVEWNCPESLIGG